MALLGLLEPECRGAGQKDRAGVLWSQADAERYGTGFPVPEAGPRPGPSIQLRLGGVPAIEAPQVPNVLPSEVHCGAAVSNGTARFSFGMIVFNGETFLHELLDSIYDFAYEIFGVEGPDQNSLPMAGPDGGSTDRTVEILRSYPDPERKLRVIRGTWRDKDEQSNRYMDEVSGDYIWQVDDDEIYKPEDLA